VFFDPFFDMYDLQYFYEPSAEWRSTFVSTNRATVERFMREQREACGDCVSFRIVASADPLAGLSDEEYERATCPV